MADKGVKFVRIHGRIVPIKTNPGDQKGKKIKGVKKPGIAPHVTKGKAVSYLKSSSKFDKKMADTGSKFAIGFGAASLGLGALALKKKSTAAAIGSFVTGMGSLINNSFAAGREMSSKDRMNYAKQIQAGKKIKKGLLIGEASNRAYREASWLQKNIKGRKKK